MTGDRALALVWRLLNNLSIVSGVLVGAGGVFITVLTAVGVVGRYGFNFIIPVVDEYSGYMLVFLAFWGMSYVMRKQAHIRIDWVTSKFPAGVNRWLDLGNYVITLFYVSVLTVLLWKVTIMQYQDGSVSDFVSRTPIWIVYLFMPTGASLMMLEIVIQIAKRVRSPEQFARKAAAPTEEII